MTRPWMFDEFAPVGIDLDSPDAVQRYDANQGTNSAQDKALLARLGVGAGTRLVDLACGTGSFVVEAALAGADAHGVDVSVNMLDYTRRRASPYPVTGVSVEIAGLEAFWGFDA